MTNKEYYSTHQGEKLNTDWWCSKKQTLEVWLKLEYRPYKLTQFEYDLLSSIYNLCPNRRFDSDWLLMAMEQRQHFEGIDKSKTIKELLENCEVFQESY